MDGAFNVHPSMNTPSTRSQGFTLLEQAIIIAVLGILAVITVPNLMRMMERAKLNQAIAEIKGALHETQGEALRGNKICELTLDLMSGSIAGPCLTTGNRNISKDLAIATNLAQISNTTRLPTVIFAQGWPLSTLPLPLDFDQGILDFTLQPNLLHPEHPTQLAFLEGGRDPSNSRIAAIRFKVISHETMGQVVNYNLILAHHKNGTNGGGSNNSPPPHGLPSTGSAGGIPIQFGTLGNPQFDVESNVSVPTDPSAKIVLYLPNSPSIPKKCVAISNSLGLIRIGRYEGPTTPAEITDTGTCKAENWQDQ